MSQIIKQDEQENCSSQQLQQRSQRKFPIPKQVNYYILHNYANDYYNGKPEKRAQILNEISCNISHFGYNIGPDELERRFKNMKAHYRRKREDLKAGLVQSCEWEYFGILNQIFKDLPERPTPPSNNQSAASAQTSVGSQFIPNQAQTSTIDVSNQLPGQGAITSYDQPQLIAPQTSSQLPAASISAQLKYIPILQKKEQEKKRSRVSQKKLILFPKDSVESQKCEQKNEQKRKSESIEDVAIEVKKEQIEITPAEKIKTESIEGPLDMSMKRTKIIEFNNATDIALQLPDMACVSEETRKKAIKRISDELNTIDTERINVDEKRLKLEIRRNELDKKAYKLTGFLQELSK